MRQILMSKPGEFSFDKRVDFLRGSAVKMLASLIQKPAENEIGEEKVVVSSVALKSKRDERR